MHNATASKRGKDEREKESRDTEKPALSCHINSCQVLFIYINDLMMILWYLILLPPTRDTLKILSICFFYYLFDCKNYWEKIALCQSQKQFCDLSKKKNLLLVSTWFKFTWTNKLFHTIETSNKLGRELCPSWDLLKTPLDLAGACFSCLREKPSHWSNYLLNSYLKPWAASWD